jgi:serine/threonine-protein kinase
LQARWAEVERCLDQVLDLEPDARPELLARIRSDAPEIGAEVERLLDAMSSNKEFLQNPAPAYAAPLITGMVEEHDLAPGTVLGNYEITGELGRGGMATVYLATDRRLNRPVAIKVLRPGIARGLGADRFLREIEIVSRLSHPHILPLLDSGGSGEFLWYAMPYVEGNTLRLLLERERRLSIEQALKIAADLATALSWAHAHDIVHRDIKPENILLQDDQAILTDFGLARAIQIASGQQLTSSGLLMGTPCYMSPEQADPDAVIDGRSDIYSLGCTLYEMLAGQPPFQGPDAQSIVAQHLACPAPSLKVLRPTVPDWLDAVVQTALAKTPADRFSSAAELSDALSAREGFTASRRGRQAPSTLSRSRKRHLFALRSAMLLGLGALLTWGTGALRSGERPALDENLVAIAPFDVIGAGTEIWREGVIDLLSRNLDGAGPLRVITPAIAIREWSRMAHQASAQQLGYRTGAGLSIAGSVVLSGGDSVVLSASVHDLDAEEILGEVRVAGPAFRIDLVVDSLTMGLLHAISRTRPIGAVRVAAARSASLPALKAYLQGEQYFRRAAWDSATGYFERAAELDPRFALAFHRIFQSRGFPTPGIDSLVWTYALRAGALNHGLPARESLLIAADSILAPIVVASQPDTVIIYRVNRALGILQVAARQFPNDPEVWYQIGRTRSRFGWLVGVMPQQTVESLRRAIELDSAFAPAYVELLGIAMVAEGAEATNRYLADYLRLQPTGPPANVARFAYLLMNPQQARPGEVEAILDTASAVLLYQTFTILEWWPDSAETATRLARELVTRPPDPNLSSDPAFGRRVLSYSLAWRGHVEEAYRIRSSSWLAFFSELALLGGVPPDTASAVFGRTLQANPWPSPNLVFALPWWCQLGDTISLLEVVTRADRLHPSARKDPATGYLREAARAYLALSRADTTTALERFLSLSHSTNYLAIGDWERYVTIRLLNSRRRYRDALERINKEVRSTAWPYDVLVAFERGRALEGLRDGKAALSYTEVADAWAHADRSLQPVVRESRAALTRLEQ